MTYFSLFSILPSDACRIKWSLLTFLFLACFTLTVGCYQESPSPDSEKALDLLILLLDDRDTLVRRNAVEAMGKIGDLKSKPMLLGKLDDPEPLVREAAVRSLGWFSGLDPETRSRLTMLLRDDDPSVQQAASQALNRN